MIRRKFLTTAGMGLVGVSFSPLGDLISGQGKNEILKIYIGCYTSKPSEGIATGILLLSTGELTLPGKATEANNPSFLALSPDAGFLYAVNETREFQGIPGGGVSAYRIDRKSGSLEWLNSQPSMGADPCHLSLSRNGKFVLVANYTGGNVSVLPVLPDGQLGPAVCVRQHFGQGPNVSRQEKAHAHSINLSPDNRFAFVCDLGIDRIMIYAFDEMTGKLTPASTPFFQSAPGAGPRHFTFSPDGQHAFVINELNSTLTSLRFDPSSGSLTEIQTMSTLPESFRGENTCADVHIHPNGRFIYGSNRGHDTIAIFSLDQKSGRFQASGHQFSGGKTPRNFAIDPSGEFLLTANQNSDNIFVFKINPKDGTLTPTIGSAIISGPVCLVFTIDH